MLCFSDNVKHLKNSKYFILIILLNDYSIIDNNKSKMKQKYPKWFYTLILDCQELIKLCLSQTPEKRIKLEDVRSHIWTTKKFSLLHRTESSCSTLISRYSSQKPFQKILKRRSIKRNQGRKRDSQAASGCVTDLSGSSDSEDSGDDTYSGTGNIVIWWI